MTLKAGICTSYKREILQGVHQAGDVYKIALYNSKAKLSHETTSYTAEGEIEGQGYVKGGEKLQGFAVGGSKLIAWLDFADVKWTLATITARGAMIYNETREKRVVCVIDFGADKSSSDGDFVIMLPVPDENNALLRF